MRNWERGLSVLEALWERGRVAGHGWTLDTELLSPHQQQVNALEARAWWSLPAGRPCGAVGPGGSARAVGGPFDAVRPRHSRVRPVPPPGRASARGGGPGRELVELIPLDTAALRVFVGLTGRLRVPPADRLAEQVRTASCDHGIKRWRLYLTQEQMDSVAYALWLHRMTGSAAEANRLAREYGVAHTPSSRPVPAGTRRRRDGGAGQGRALRRAGPAGASDVDGLVGAVAEALGERMQATRCAVAHSAFGCASWRGPRPVC